MEPVRPITKAEIPSRSNEREGLARSSGPVVTGVTRTSDSRTNDSRMGTNEPKLKDRRRKPRKMWLRVVLVVILLVGGYFAVRALWPSSQTTYLTAAAKRGEFEVVVVETGELQAEHSQAVTAPVMASGGRMQLAITYLAPEGTRVDSGTMLVGFDPADQFKTISDKENDLKSAQADLDKLNAQQKSDKEDAQMSYENAKLAYQLAQLSDSEMRFESASKQSESKLELKKSELAYNQAKDNLKGKSLVRKSELATLNLKIAQIESTLNQAKGDADKLAVHAPAAGLIVYQRNWSTGKKFVRGDQCWAGQPVMLLPDLSHMQALLEVNEVDISKVKTGQQAEVRLDAFPERKFSGTIKNVASIGNPKETNPSVKVFEVMVDLDQADSILRPGMTVSARIQVSTIPNVVSIPIEAVFDDNGKPVVYVEKGSSLEKRSVTLGEKNDNFIIVTKGVYEGENVSLTDPNADPDEDTNPSGNTRQKKSNAPAAKV